jgi:chromosome segregation ATPase
MSKNINDASLANLKHYEGKWRSGATRTIRVPIALADATLEYARQLDKGAELSDTSDLNDEVKQLKGEIERLQDELSRLRAENETLRQKLAKEKQGHEAQVGISQVFNLQSQRLQSQLEKVQAENDELKDEQLVAEFELPEPAELLNRFKAEYPKSKLTYRELKALLEMIEE